MVSSRPRRNTLDRRSMSAFQLACICCQMLWSCGEPSSSSTSYPHTSRVLEDAEKAVRNCVLSPKGMPLHFYNSSPQTPSKICSQSSGSMQRFIVGFQLPTDCFGPAKARAPSNCLFPAFRCVASVSVHRSQRAGLLSSSGLQA